MPVLGQPCNSSPANLSKVLHYCRAESGLTVHVAALAVPMTIAVSAENVTVLGGCNWSNSHEHTETRRRLRTRCYINSMREAASRTSLSQLPA